MHYDSLLGGNCFSTKKAEGVVQKLCSELPRWRLPAKVHNCHVLTQTNSYDCGVFVWLTMEIVWRKHLGWSELDLLQGPVTEAVRRRRQYLNLLSEADIKFREAVLKGETSAGALDIS